MSHESEIHRLVLEKNWHLKTKIIQRVMKEKKQENILNYSITLKILFKADRLKCIQSVNPKKLSKIKLSLYFRLKCSFKSTLSVISSCSVQPQTRMHIISGELQPIQALPKKTN